MLEEEEGRRRGAKGSWEGQAKGRGCEGGVFFSGEGGREEGGREGLVKRGGGECWWRGGFFLWREGGEVGWEFFFLGGKGGRGVRFGEVAGGMGGRGEGGAEGREGGGWRGLFDRTELSDEFTFWSSGRGPKYLNFFRGKFKNSNH